MRVFLFLMMATLLFSSCSQLKTEVVSSPVSTQQPPPTSTKISEESLIATEQAMASTVQAEVALTSAAQPTFTPQPTLTSKPAYWPTLTPISNSTPTSKGAYFDIPSDVLGPRYEIKNAYYFDDPKTGERYEFYAGALAGSGDEETAQGAMVLRVLRFSEKLGNAEVITTQEYQTPIQVGPLRIKVDFSESIILFTPLHFEWTYLVNHGEMIDTGNPPVARLEIGKEKQLAGRGSYCWSSGCLDGPGVSTSTIPLVLQSSFIVHLHLPLVEPPTELSLQTMLVSSPGHLEFESVSDSEASWSYEKPGRELLDQGSLPLRQDQDIKLSLAPGYHVLVIFAAWRDYGDVKYGFLIEVKQ